VGVIDSVEIIDIHRIKEVILGIEKYEGLSSEVQSRTVLSILNRKHSWPQFFLYRREKKFWNVGGGLVFTSKRMRVWFNFDVNH
jgi:hypothetical protein